MTQGDVMLIEKRMDIRGEVFWYNPQTQEAFRRVVGGLGWPARGRPGFLLIMGEGEDLDVFVKHRPLKILAEASEDLLERLFHRMLEFGESYRIEDVYTEPSKGMMDLYRNFSRRINSRWLPYLLRAPRHDDPNNLPYYLHIIERFLIPEAKILRFGENSQLPSHLMALSPEQAEGRANEWPAIAALGYALSALELYAPPPDPRTLQQMVIRDYDPLDLWD